MSLYPLMTLLTPLIFLTLLIFFTGSVVSAIPKCELESIDIVSVNGITSQYTFNLSVKDPNCTKDGKLNIYARQCNSTDLHNTSFCRVQAGNGKRKCPVTSAKGRLLQAYNEESGVISKTCFSLRGLDISLGMFTMEFNQKQMQIKLQKADERVKSWTVTAYELQKESLPKEEDENGPWCPSREPGRDKRVEKWEGIGNNSSMEVQFQHSFSTERCFCFQVLANGFQGTNIDNNKNYIKERCIPKSIAPDVIGPDETSINWWMPAIILLSVILVLVIIWKIKNRASNSHVEVSQNDGPVTSEDNEETRDVERQTNGNEMKQNNGGVFVIYAQHDANHLNLVYNVMQSLQNHLNICKVYDIHKHMAEEDGHEWIRNRIAKDMILIILSPTLNQHLRTLFSTKNSDENDKNPALAYALNLIVNGDYSKVFVARFSSECQDGEDYSDVHHVLVKRLKRIYDLPKHQEELHSMFQGLF